jgi:lipopolysaccharide export system permease protein
VFLVSCGPAPGRSIADYFRAILESQSKPMIFRKALWRELANNCLAALVVLLAIVFTTQLIRILGRAARGEVATEAVLAFVGFGLLDHLPILLSLALFMAVMMALSRAYRESEMVVWSSAGLGLTAFIRPVILFAAPVVMLITVLSLVMLPWSVDRRESYRKQLERKSDVSTIAPGVFSESRHADRVFFVESLGAVGTEIHNVFVQSAADGKLSVIYAQSGHQKIEPDGQRFLVLEHGRRYEGEPGAADFNSVEFRQYSLRIQDKPLTKAVEDIRSSSTADLVAGGGKARFAELVWRLGNPVGSLVLALLAIPLSFVNPRAGRSVSLVMAVLVYMIYNNMVGISQAWILQGRISAAVGFFGVHGFMTVVLVALFRYRASLAVPGGRR